MWNDDNNYNEQPWYDVMQVCINGHKITGMAKYHPENLVNNCSKCGAETTTKCPKCNAEIPGYKHYPRVSSPDYSKPPDFCPSCGEKFPWTKMKKGESVALIETALDKIFKILKKFHNVAKQLRDRHGNRPTLEIEDEYDVQDLLHALLKIEFDDIRPEEWAPSYAGSSSRMDFLLKNEKIVIETKKTRKGLGSKEIGEELIVDIAKYKEHPDCNILMCFVYDPEGRISNQAGLKSDLEKQSSDKLKVYLIIFSS